MSFVVFPCRNCGAGIEAPPDNLLTICAYCGDRYASQTMGDMPIFLTPTAPKNEIVAAVEKRMATDKQMQGKQIQIDVAEGIYIPIFITKTALNGSWKGYKKVKRNKTMQKEWKSGNVSLSGDYPVVGRKHAYEFGMSSIGHVLFQQKIVSFDEVDWSEIRLPVLNVDIEESNVDLIIKDDTLNFLGDQIRKRESLSAFTNFDIEVEMHDRCVLFFPFWTVTYQFEGGLYRVAVSGGDKQVLSAMEPVFFSRRIWLWCKGIAGILGVGISCDISLWLMEENSDNTLEIIVGCFAVCSFCFYMAWSTATQVTKSIQVESIGKKEELL